MANHAVVSMFPVNVIIAKSIKLCRVGYFWKRLPTACTLIFLLSNRVGYIG